MYTQAVSSYICIARYLCGSCASCNYIGLRNPFSIYAKNLIQISVGAKYVPKTNSEWQPQTAYSYFVFWSAFWTHNASAPAYQILSKSDNVWLSYRNNDEIRQIFKMAAVRHIRLYPLSHIVAQRKVRKILCQSAEQFSTYTDFYCRRFELESPCFQLL